MGWRSQDRTHLPARRESNTQTSRRESGNVVIPYRRHPCLLR